MIKFNCDRCGKDMPFARREANLAVYHEKGISYSLTIQVSIIDDYKGEIHICEDCVKELTKTAASTA